MSIQAARDFWKQVETDQQIADKLGAAKSGDWDAELAAAVRIGSQAGFSFSTDDFKQSVQERADADYAAGKLTDAEKTDLDAYLNYYTLTHQKGCK